MAEELEAITLEDEDPLDYIGEEAEAPDDRGPGPADEDLDPPDEDSVVEDERQEAPAR